MVKNRRTTAGGFSLLELLLVVAVAGTLMAIALPIFNDLAESQRLNSAARDVERELQAARLKAVSTNEALRVRLNCPLVGEYRRVEVIGSAADSASDRCSPVTYPYPPADTDLMTRPNHDGPVRILSQGTTVTSQILEFRPDGTAEEVVAGVAQPIATTVTITVTRRSATKTVTVNALGKVQIQ